MSQEFLTMYDMTKPPVSPLETGGFASPCRKRTDMQVKKISTCHGFFVPFLLIFAMGYARVKLLYNGNLETFPQ